jgi:hypothetical protein
MAMRIVMAARWRMSAAALLALTMLGCGRGGGSVEPDTAARATVRNFYFAIIREDWPAAFALLEPQSQSRFGADAFADAARQYRASFGFEPVSVEIRSCDEKGDRAKARVIVTGKSASAKHRFRDAIDLRKSSSNWGVAPAEDFGRERR